MTNDDIKQKLLSVRDAPLDFTVVQSGKKSKKVHGLYKVDSREIVIHNKNFERGAADGTKIVDDNLLFYTAVHEYAHHLHACSLGGRLPKRPHTHEFWAILHDLLDDAEAKGICKNVFENSPELVELTALIREKYLKTSAELLIDFGKALISAHEICQREGCRFEDYVDRVLRIPRASGFSAMKLPAMNLSPEVGPENLKFLSTIRDETSRENAQAAILEGKSPERVRAALKRESAPEIDDTTRLEKEKSRIQHTIDTLQKRLDEIERELEDI